jgi:hypothetical protein
MKLKVRAQLGEQAKAINLVNVGLQKTAQRRFIYCLHDFRLIEWTKKPALREHTGFDGHLPTHADRSNRLRWNRLLAWAAYKRANRPGSITMSSEHRTQRLQKVQS